jgi:hypothetical protein
VVNLPRWPLEGSRDGFADVKSYLKYVVLPKYWYSRRCQNLGDHTLSSEDEMLRRFLGLISDHTLSSEAGYQKGFRPRLQPTSQRFQQCNLSLFCWESAECNLMHVSAYSTEFSTSF